MKFTLFTLATIMALNVLQAQSVDEIVSKHAEAIGGMEKIAQVKTVQLESTADVMGNESTTKTIIVNGKSFKSESNFNGQKIVQVVNGTSGWAINPFGGSNNPEALSEEQLKVGRDQVFVPDPLINYAEHGAKLELVGQEKVGDINAYKLKYTSKDNAETMYFIDPNTWHIVQAVKTGNMMGQEITIAAKYSDYRKTDFGISIPYSTIVDMGQFALTTNVKNVEINKPVDESIFEMGK